MKKIANFYNHFEEYLLIASLVFTVIVVFLQVIMRFVFSNAFTWSEEVTRYIYVWQIWLGASLAVREGKHIRVEIIFGIFKGKGRIIVEMLADIIWCAFCIVMVIAAIGWMGMLLRTGQVTPAVRMPVYLGAFAVPVGCGLMAIRLFGVIAGHIKRLGGKVEVSQ